ncbi:hypothetical protein PTKIN_Ptkin06aG0179100 [Pterospermum kingtungense]
MEGRKERKSTEKKVEAKPIREEAKGEDDAAAHASFESTTKTTAMDPMGKVVINEAVNQGNEAQNPDDVLAFSRSVHKIDSSLE